MTTIDVLDAAGEKSGRLELPAEIFDAKVNIPLIHQVVVAQLAAARQGTHDTKNRGEVAGGGRKPYRQKGTGRARQGSIRAPQFAGGGVVHGPTPHGYEQRTPKKMKAAALRGALSDRARDGRVHVVEALVEGDAPSTRAALATLLKVTTRPRVLVVIERDDDISWLSLRNVDTAHLLSVDQLNTYDVLLSDDVVFTRAAYDALVATRGKGSSSTATSESADTALAESTDAAAAGLGAGVVSDSPEPAGATAAPEAVETAPAESTDAASAGLGASIVDESPEPAGATAAADEASTDDAATDEPATAEPAVPAAGVVETTETDEEVQQ